MHTVSKLLSKPSKPIVIQRREYTCRHWRSVGKEFHGPSLMHTRRVCLLRATCHAMPPASLRVAPIFKGRPLDRGKKRKRQPGDKDTVGTSVWDVCGDNGGANPAAASAWQPWSGRNEALLVRRCCQCQRAKSGSPGQGE